MMLCTLSSSGGPSLFSGVETGGQRFASGKGGGGLIWDGADSVVESIICRSARRRRRRMLH